MKIQQSERGATLVESMMASAVFLIAIVSIAYLAINSMRMLRQSSNISIATNLASNTLDELMLQDFATIEGASAPIYYNRNGIKRANERGSHFTVIWRASKTVTHADVEVRTYWRSGPLAPTKPSEAEHSIRLVGKVATR